MSKRKYIILRDFQHDAPPAFPVGVRRFRSGFGKSVPSAEVEVAELERGDLGILARDATVEAAAPAMPVKLIAPLPFHGAATAASTGNATWGLEAIGALATPYDGQGVKVAVLDTGIDPTHAAFAGVTLERRNYTSESDDDTDGHGTHCAATIFGRDVAGTRIGVARGITDAFIGKVLGRDGGGSDQIARAIMDAVEAGCQVISMSLGIDLPGYTKSLIDDGFPADFAAALALADYRANIRLFDRIGELVEAQASFRNREIALIAAAGNEARRDIDPNYEFPATPPSEAEGFISVGAAGQAGAHVEIADFSNTGCQICGPGVGVVSAQAGAANGLVAHSGTSMATPHVAGVAALWLQALRPADAPTGWFPMAPGQLKARLLASGDPSVFGPNYDPYDAGAGMVRCP